MIILLTWVLLDFYFIMKHFNSFYYVSKIVEKLWLLCILIVFCFVFRLKKICFLQHFCVRETFCCLRSKGLEEVMRQIQIFEKNAWIIAYMSIFIGIFSYSLQLVYSSIFHYSGFIPRVLNFQSSVPKTIQKINDTNECG